MQVVQCLPHVPMHSTDAHIYTQTPHPPHTSATHLQVVQCLTHVSICSEDDGFQAVLCVVDLQPDSRRTAQHNSSLNTALRIICCGKIAPQPCSSFAHILQYVQICRVGRKRLCILYMNVRIVISLLTAYRMHTACMSTICMVLANLRNTRF